MINNKDQIYLKHILLCIQKIKTYTKNGKNDFFNNEMAQDAILRRLQTMAESTQRLSDDLKTSLSNIDWRSLSGFRNILVHDYLDGIDLDTVWNVIENYLPDLEIIINNITK